ncbi:hypothetical protein [Clostridium kluyveri]|nr:hypothetical protein [Clostridium kluyveri]
MNMITFIKTAVVTIIISFISGWLLDHYKSLAPKILCNVGNGVPIKINNKKIHAYVVTITNASNKIIHELTINIQSLKNNLQITDAKITKGLKFHSSIKDNVLDVSIPFLSKKDKFSVTLYIEDKDGLQSEPFITIRSPEKFKEIRSIGKTGKVSLLSDRPQNINGKISKKTRKTKPMSFNKKTLVSITSIILVIMIGILGKFYFKGLFTSAKTTDKTTVHQQSTDNTESSNKTTKNTDSKTSSNNTNGDINSKVSSDGTTKNTDSQTSSDGTTKNTDSQTSSDGTTKNTDSKTSSDGTTKNTDSQTSSDGTTKNTDSKTSSDETTKNTNSQTSSNETTENTAN